MPANRKAQIERINQVSAMARTSWIALLGYLAFIGVTLLGVEDADFFVPSRQTQLPLVNVSIPTASFFIFAPILAAALYIYLHIILLKLWDAIADATSPRIDGHPLGDHLNPWLVNDWALDPQGRRPSPPPARSAPSATSRASSSSGPPRPLVLARLLVALDARPRRVAHPRSSPPASSLALHAGLTSWRTARAWLARPRREPAVRPWLAQPAGLAALLARRRQLAPHRRRRRLLAAA